MSASIPLSTTFTATSVAVSSTGSLNPAPIPRDLAQAASFHVFAFAPRGDLLVSESEGSFSLDQWNEVYAVAERVCCDENELAKRGSMVVERDAVGAEYLHSALKEAINAKVQRGQSWKPAT